MATALIRVQCCLILIFSILENVDSYCFILTDDMRSYSGILQNGVTKVSDCIQICSNDPTCKGITWHRQYGCFIVAQMESRQPDDAFLLEHFTNCSSPALTDLKFCLHHRGVGTSVLLNGMVDGKDCFIVCQIVPHCIASNWDVSHHKCYLFYQTPTAIVHDVNYVYCTKQSSCSLHVTTTEYSTTYISTAADTTEEIITEDVTTDIAVTWSDKEGYFINENGYKGNSLLIKNSRIYCAVQCLTDIQCNGFEYNSTDLACHLKSDGFHYRRIQ